MPIVIAPEPLPDDVGQPILSPSQLQALAQMAQALEAVNRQPAITSLTVPGVTVLPGQTQVIGRHRPAEPGGRVPGKPARAGQRPREH